MAWATGAFEPQETASDGDAILSKDPRSAMSFDGRQQAACNVTQDAGRRLTYKPWSSRDAWASVSLGISSLTEATRRPTAKQNERTRRKVYRRM